MHFARGALSLFLVISIFFRPETENKKKNVMFCCLKSGGILKFVLGMLPILSTLHVCVYSVLCQQTEPWKLLCLIGELGREGCHLFVRPI